MFSFLGFNPSIMIDFCKSLDLNLIVYDARDVYKILLANKEDDKHLPCSICSKMKKLKNRGNFASVCHSGMLL